MPRLSDVPKVARSVGVLPFAKRVWAQIAEDNLFTWAAALAYSWLFAVFPFLLFLLTLLPYLPAEWTTVAAALPMEPQALGGLGVLERGEKDLILRVLQESGFNKKQAALRLGISRPTLYQKIRKYHLKVK